MEFLDEKMTHISHLLVEDESGLTHVLDLEDTFDGLLSSGNLEKVLQAISSYDWQGRPQEQVNQAVLRFGAFLGQYIREHHPDKNWHWISAATAFQLTQHDFFKVNSLSNLRLLYNQGTGKFLYPLAEVVDHIQKGGQHDLSSYLQGVLES